MYENKRIEPTTIPPLQHGGQVNYLAHPVHKILEQHAKNTPDAIAIRYNNREMTYAELNQSASQLAYHINKMQIGAEDCIAVCLEPSPYVLIALLGILKAGAVYVPIDPSYPQARINQILEIIKPALVLSEQYLMDRLKLEGPSFLYLDNLPPQNESFSCIPQANQTAYIFFTSGSEGAPKGVMATHANISHYTQVAIERYRMNFSTVMPTIARFSFSISLFELLCPLLSGGTVVILDRAHVLDMSKMAETLSKVTMFHAGPSFLKNFFLYIQNKGNDFSSFDGVQHASSGGDMVPPELLELMKKVFPNAEVFVIYGSTEIACMGCTFQVPRDQCLMKTYVGHPFPKTKIRIIDKLFNEVPQGMEGEVCFTGEGITKGYLHKPELTKDKFIIMDGLRYYRMGDLGRINETGELELLGREDFQIKIRGMRVELSSVEYILRKAPGVRDGVVVGLDLGNSGEKTLIAYVVFADSNPRDIKAINAYVSHHLPDYMVPSGYVELTELPLNLNMKLDRKALHDPRGLILLRQGGELIRAPESPTQIGIANLMQKILATNKVGLDDNFFDLGGHSVAAIELMIKVEETFGVSLKSMDVLRETVEVLARDVDKLLGQEIYNSQPTKLATTSLTNIESFYFGPNDDLYGVFHRPKGDIEKAVLICNPLPHECDRLDFVLNRLARRLVLNNIAVLQFHYFGTRDSAGEGPITSLKRWEEDILMAGAELQQRSGKTKFVGIGTRLGATMLSRANESLQCEGLVFWDPIFDGKKYLTDLEKQHQLSVIDLMTIREKPPVSKFPNTTELLGTTYSKIALEELSSIVFSPSISTSLPIVWMASTEKEAQLDAYQSLSNSHPNSKFQTIQVEMLHVELELMWMQSMLGIPDMGLSKLLEDAVNLL